MADLFDIFLVAPPGLEPVLMREARELGFKDARYVPGGVTLKGDWAAVMRCNLEARGATRVLVRIGSFRAFHLAQLDKRARKFPWADFLRSDVPVRVEVATNKKSKIYHAGAAQQRIETAIREELGAPVSDVAEEAALLIKVRIDDNTVVISVDTSGESLHKRGHKEAVGKAPMRETLAALFLRAAGFDGTQPVLDPMCGSGTFVIEAAERALGLQAGRSRAFALSQLVGIDTAAMDGMRRTDPKRAIDFKFFGSDRNDGAIENARQNAARAGVAEVTAFRKAAISDLERPEGPAGLIIVNPPYGARIGNKKQLFALHGAMGQVFKERFKDWRVGIVTSDGALANATGLPFEPAGPPVPHGGLKVRLYQTGALA